MIIATPSGGIKEDMGRFPPVGGSLPTPPSLRRRNKINKISYIRRICGFLTLRIAFCPLDTPPQEKKNLVQPLATSSSGLIKS